MRKFYTVAAVVLSAAALNPSYAQRKDDDASSVEQAAAAHLRPQIGSDIALEIRSQRPDGWRVIHSPARLRALARALGATQVRGDTIFVCGRTPSDCKIRNFKSLVTFDEPKIAGNAATILVTLRSRTGLQRVPVQRQEFEVSLTRAGTTWKVTDVKTVSVS